MKDEQPTLLKQQAQALLRENRLDGAKDLYVRVCEQAPTDADAWCKLGSIYGMLGHMEQAEDCCRRAIAIRPDLPVAHRNLGNVLMIQGRHREALETYRRVLNIRPDYPDVHNNVGNILTDQGKFEEACESYLNALRMDPSFVEAYINLGVVCADMGHAQEATQCFHKALAINPRCVDALVKLGDLLVDRGDHVEALSHYRKAHGLSPGHEGALGGLAQALRHVRLSKYHPWLDEVMIAVLRSRGVDHQRLSAVIVEHLQLKYADHRGADSDNRRLAGVIDAIEGDELFSLFLTTVVNTNGDMELLLAAVRRAMLSDHRAKRPMGGNGRKVAALLALQCNRNEYVYHVDDEEQEYLGVLRRAIDKRVNEATSVDGDLEADLLVFSMYDRSFGLPCRDRLARFGTAAWSQPLRSVMEKTLLEPLEEEALKGRIVPLAMTDDATSRLVRAQYEENPYPRWEHLPAVAKTTIGRVLKRKFPHFIAPDHLDGTVRILVAGCGTGREPIFTALQHPDAQVMAVDLSAGSLAYAMRMAKKHAVDNIEFVQGDILALSSLDRGFDVIVCSGVLHHMENPLQGWTVLSSLLVNNGLMKVALYSEKARRVVARAREVIRNDRLTSGKDDIRRLRSRILTGRKRQSLREVTEFTDFFSLSECRDLLFHAMEHRFTCKQLKETIAKQGLEFVGFEIVDAEPVKKYRSHFPEDATITDLDCWDRFEDLYPETFRGMYHFWCQKRT